MGIFGKSRKEPVVKTPPMTIVPIKKKPAKKAVRKTAAKRPAPKKTSAKRQLSRNGYLCFYKIVETRGGGKTRLYFWAKKAKSGEGWRKVYAVPEGKVVRISKTGLPVLANKDSRPAAKKSAATHRPQCAAVTPDGKQCKNSARSGSKYCGSHKGYRPKKADAKAADTKPRVAKAKDTAPKGRKTAAKKSAATHRPQCAAVTPDGKQCKNSARSGSKYCGSHKGYRPKKADAKAADTKPRVAKAKDTAPKGRKSSAKKAKPTQITRRGYLLYKSGPRYFFSKKKTAQKGWTRINKIPTGFKVKVTDSGLPVLARK